MSIQRCAVGVYRVNIGEDVNKRRELEQVGNAEIQERCLQPAGQVVTVE
jgi:hypothetical protein